MTAWRSRRSGTCFGTIVLHSDGEYECLEGECGSVGDAYHDTGLKCSWSGMNRNTLKKMCPACELRDDSHENARPESLH
jgi:hypothetical protein